MADVPASLDSVYRIVGALERVRMPYAFIGGVALNTWGVPRATFDLDLTLSVPTGRDGELLGELRRIGVVVEEAFEGGFRDRVQGMEKLHVHLPAGASLMAIDLFEATTPFLESVLERRIEIDLGRGRLWVCSAADLILLKPLADRRKDRVDVENVLLVQGVPEPEYLRRWAAALGLEQRLTRALERRPRP
jgi:hypothetical protein